MAWTCAGAAVWGRDWLFGSWLKDNGTPSWADCSIFGKTFEAPMTRPQFEVHSLIGRFRRHAHRPCKNRQLVISCSCAMVIWQLHSFASFPASLQLLLLTEHAFCNTTWENLDSWGRTGNKAKLFLSQRVALELDITFTCRLTEDNAHTQCTCWVYKRS